MIFIRYYTHVATAVAGTIALTELNNQSLTLPIIAGTIIGSLIPDIDEPKSYIGRRSLGVSHVVNKKYGHRGGTHSLIIWFILMGLLLTVANNKFTIGICIGYLLHIVGDFFSSKGVPLLLPFTNKRFKFFITYRTGGWLEKIILCLAITYSTLKLTDVIKGIFYAMFI
ncbi:MAG: metal-dependent hydrolase [Bacillaceae bacterium]